jgi:hypothetical protein
MDYTIYFKGDYQVREFKRNKTSISNAQTYREIGDFWDTHDLGDHWNKGKDVSFEVKLETEVILLSFGKEII